VNAANLWGVALLATFAACGPRFYHPCDDAKQCEDVVPDGADAECVETSGEGFCSWQCVVDDDCDGDHDDDHDFVCASFESNPATYCFPSCAGDGTDSSGGACPEGYTCRSTGGGDANEKVCYPDG
jgi:hypothetical protein